MRSHYDAIGRICAAAVANGDSIQDSHNELRGDGDDLLLQISHRGVPVLVVGKPSTQYFLVVDERRFSFYEGFDPTDLARIERGKDVLFDHPSSSGFDGITTAIPFEHETGATLLDGVKIKRHIYPYSQDFSLAEYRTVLRDVIERTSTIFDYLTEEFEIQLDSAAVENEAPNTGGGQGRSFQ